MQSPQPFKVCPQCQQPTVIDAAVCQRCGRVYRSTAPIPQVTQTFTADGRKPSTLPLFANWCAKWGAVGWSVLCLAGLLYGMNRAGQHIDQYRGGPGETGASIGIAIGIGMWAFIWLAVAGPCAVVYFLTRPRGS